jgi:hypothetical protein
MYADRGIYPSFFVADFECGEKVRGSCCGINADAYDTAIEYIKRNETSINSNIHKHSFIAVSPSSISSTA